MRDAALQVGALCHDCHAPIEPELAAVHPSATICLDCMDEPELRRLERDLNKVQEFDRAGLVDVADMPGWDVGRYYRPSRLLSGDFYGVRPVGAGERLRFVLGDVMGKGIPAALLRAGLQSSVEALGRQVDSPARVLREANQQFTIDQAPGRIASVFYGVAESEAGVVRYANGGHVPPLVRRASGAWSQLPSTGLVLGAFADASYEEREVRLSPGDLLLTFSDGFTEAENEAGEAFDETEIRRRVDENPEAPAQVLASTLADALSRFAPGEPSDDRTLVVMRRP